MQGRMKSTHLLAVAAIGSAFVLLAAGCGSGGGAKNAVVVGTTDSGVTAIDPAGSYDLPSSTLQYNLYQQLLRIPPGGHKPVPDAAKSCRFTNPKTYSCTLRSGLKFSNGDPLTATDVKYSFDRNAKINNPNGAWTIYGDQYGGITTPNSKTVVFHLKTPDATWPVKLTYSGASVVDHKVFPKNKLLSDSKIVGSGPYKLSKFEKGQQAVLAANPKYSGQEKPKSKSVIVRYYQQASSLKLAIEQGDVDVAYRNLAPTDIKSLEKESSKGIKVVSGAGTEIRYLVFNVKKKPFDNKNVRQAMAQVIDRKAINNNVYNGDFTPLYSPVPKGLPGHIDSLKRKYGAPNPKKAKALLRKAGKKAPLPITMWYTPTHYGPATADELNEIKRQLDASGVFKVTVKNTEWVQYQKSYNQEQLYSVYHLGWFPDYPDSNDYVEPFMVKGGFYHNNYDNPQVDKLVAKEEKQTSQAKRIPTFRKLQQIEATDLPILPLWQARQQAAVRKGVTGVQQTFDPSYTFRLYLISKS